MKNPNGYGSVVKLSGNRRKKFVVRKTIGWKQNGYPIYNIIGYAETREEGNIMLARYNNDPWDINHAKITLKELWELYLEKRVPKLNERTASALKSSFNHAKKYWNYKYKELKSFHMQDCIDNCKKGYSTQGAIKTFFRHLDKFALELDIINKSYAQLITTESIPETNKVPFTDEEIATLWEHENDEWVDVVLVLIYTGFRLEEIIILKLENIDLENGTLTGGIKTQAGKNRIIPIHSKIRHLVEKRVKNSKVYLFELNNLQLTKFNFYKIWNDIMKKYNMQHTPHECRHTFRTMLDSAGANKKCIDMLMGHKSKEVGERVYTHKTVQELKEAIELVTR